MKFQHNFFILIFSFFVTLSSFSQEMSVHDQGSKSMWHRKVIGLENQILIANTGGGFNKGKIMINFYSKDVKFIEQKLFEYPKKGSYQDLIKIGGDVFICYSVKDKKSKKVNYYAKDIKAKNSDKLLMGIPYTKYKKDLQIIQKYIARDESVLPRDYSILEVSTFSANEKNWLLPFITNDVEDDKLNVNLTVAINSLDNLKTYNKQISVENEDAEVYQRYIDNEGNIVLVIRTPFNKAKEYKFEIYSISNKAELKKIDEVYSNLNILDVKLNLIGNDLLVASGFYSENDKNFKYNGIYFFKSNYITGKSIEKFSEKVSDMGSFDEGGESDVYDEKKMYHFSMCDNPTATKNTQIVIDGIVEREDGKGYVLFFKKHTRMSASSTCGIPGGYYYIPTSIYTVLINKDEKFIPLEGIGVLKLYNRTDLVGGISQNKNGFAYKYKNEKIYYMYSNEKTLYTGESFLYEYDFKEQNKKLVLNDESVILLPESKTLLPNGDILIFAKKSGSLLNKSKELVLIKF